MTTHQRFLISFLIDALQMDSQKKQWLEGIHMMTRYEQVILDLIEHPHYYARMHRLQCTYYGDESFLSLCHWTRRQNSRCAAHW